MGFVWEARQEMLDKREMVAKKESGRRGGDMGEVMTAHHDARIRSHQTDNVHDRILARVSGQRWTWFVRDLCQAV